MVGSWESPVLRKVTCLCLSLQQKCIPYYGEYKTVTAFCVVASQINSCMFSIALVNIFKECVYDRLWFIIRVCLCVSLGAERVGTCWGGGGKCVLLHAQAISVEWCGFRTRARTHTPQCLYFFRGSTVFETVLSGGWRSNLIHCFKEKRRKETKMWNR
jgi:hypothetical protein